MEMNISSEINLLFYGDTVVIIIVQNFELNKKLENICFKMISTYRYSQ